MTEQEARSDLERIMALAQKSRSITCESWCKQAGKEDLDGIDEICLEGIDRILWRRGANLVESITRVLGKREVAPIDYYNILVLANKSDMLLLEAELQEAPFPQPSITLLAQGWEPEIASTEQTRRVQ